MLQGQVAKVSVWGVSIDELHCYRPLHLLSGIFYVVGDAGRQHDADFFANLMAMSWARVANMREIIRDAWEFETDEQALLALAGASTFDSYLQDRQQRAAELLSSLRIQSHHRTFEIGSGDGTVAKLLSPHCSFIDCNDISASFLAKARKNCIGIANVAFHQIGTGYLDYLPSGAYDVGYSLNVFIHFNPYDIFNYLRDVQRILRVGGVFSFDACTIGKQTVELFHTHAQFYKDDPTRVRGLLNFNHPDLIRTIIEDVGLHIIDGFHTSNEGWLRILIKK